MTIPSPASVVVDRRVEWQDTDAAGHSHHSTLIPGAEPAEAALLDRLNLAGLFGTIPRVRYEVDYAERLWFGDIATITLSVDRVGTSSLRYEFVVTHGEKSVARGALTVVQTASESAGSKPWPDQVRAALECSGRLPGERMVTSIT